MEISLTNSLLKFIIDEADWPLIARFDKRFYVDDCGYARSTENGKPVLVHRLLLHLMDGDGNYVDHVNDNKLDNRRLNIRCVTNAENMRKRAKWVKKTKSRFKGVTWNKSVNKWHAQICKNYKPYYLGVYANEEDAARAYNTAAVRLFGEYATINNLS